MQKQNPHVAVITMNVKQESVAEFIEVFDKNAKCSRQEPGVIRFEAMQNRDTPTEFLIVEVYRAPKDQLAHRETPHFLEFKSRVAALLQEPYTPQTYAFTSVDEIA